MKKRGKKSTNLPYSEAKTFVRELQLQSAAQYRDWYDSNKPAKLPKYPNRCYKEFKSWNDWLGTDNTFGTIKRFRSFEECLAYSHSLGLKTKQQWMDYIKENELPDDIPHRPDIVFNDVWMGWEHWCGKKSSHQLQRKVLQDVTVLYVLHIPHNPSNVYTFGKHTQGAASVRQLATSRKWKIVKLYYIEGDFKINEVLSQLASQYYDSTSDWIVPNIFDVLWTLDELLEPVRSNDI